MGLKGILLWSRLHGKQDEKENDIFEALYEFSEKWKHVIGDYFDLPGAGEQSTVANGVDSKHGFHGSSPRSAT